MGGLAGCQQEQEEDEKEQEEEEQEEEEKEEEEQEEKHEEVKKEDQEQEQKIKRFVDMYVSQFRLSKRNLNGCHWVRYTEPLFVISNPAQYVL